MTTWASVKGKAAKQAANENEEEEEEEDAPLLRPAAEETRCPSAQGAEDRTEAARRGERKDSFYFLQHAMRRKDMERIEVQTARALEDEEEADDLFAEEDASGDDDAEEEEATSSEWWWWAVEVVYCDGKRAGIGSTGNGIPKKTRRGESHV